jgi:7,8-dihydroneopterin aldolase/epimerase/oxygenase
MWYVALKDVACFGYHGLYPQEKVVGNHFNINIKLGFNAKMPLIDLKETIDYQKAYDILIEEMDQPKPLLEELISTLYNRFKIEFKLLSYVNISVQKKNPSFGKNIAATEVIFEDSWH